MYKKKTRMFLATPIILVITSYWSRTASPGRRASCNPRRPMDVWTSVSQSTDGLRIKPGFAGKHCSLNNCSFLRTVYA